MLDKIDEIVTKYNDLRDKLNDEEISKDFNKYSKINKELKNIEKIVELYHKYKKLTKDLEENKKLLNVEADEEIRKLIKDEIPKEEKLIQIIEEQIKEALIPKDPNDDKNVILEIHAGIGGDEAGIFVGDLFRMYSKYAELKNWKISIISHIDSTSGGYKEIICNVIGDNAYSVLKYESGVHRVQRIPETETQGRIHTSAASVVVLPEVDDIEVDINMNDIKKDTFCSSGAGGQSVNTTYSAVRLTHIQSGLVVTCQDERSQIKNFEKALKVLKTRLYRIKLEEQQNEICDLKREIVKHGDRSDKIRTYNYPQNRITDHRINLTIYNLDKVMNGDLTEFSEALRIADNAEKLKSM